MGIRNWFEGGKGRAPRGLGVSQAELDRDPELAELQRSMLAAEAEPPGRADGPLDAPAMTRTVEWMQAGYAAGRLQEVWERRLQHGYGAGQDDAPQATWFWFNALPALAALRLGKRDHPFVATCCGLAGDAVDRSDPDQAAAQREYEHLYFG